MRTFMIAAAIPLLFASLGSAQEAANLDKKLTLEPVEATAGAGITDRSQWPTWTGQEVLSCDGVAASWAACQAMQVN